MSSISHISGVSDLRRQRLSQALKVARLFETFKEALRDACQTHLGTR
jgi:hypothetical protein